jgi:saccharopine dehydrogenase-like NADP-dependent oxidoreductase
MLSVVVVGAGHIGSTIASFLAESGGYRVTVVDRCERSLAALPKHPAIRAQVGDAEDHDALVGCLDGAFAVLSAAPYHQTIKIAEAARVAQVHYLDLTEDVTSTRAVRA